jgi:hypothetical protein
VVPLRTRTATDEHTDELLRIEGVAAGALEDGALDLRRQDGLLEEVGNQSRRVGLGERRSETDVWLRLPPPQEGSRS